MINVVIVSHSKHLAEGVAELAGQMLNPAYCQLAVAAGIDDKEHSIGTDAMKIVAAIESLANAKHIVVMMDLGSAILSTETALEHLSPELIHKVTLCSAPLVEGTLAAVVAASSGASLSTVLEEAAQSLHPKKLQLGENSTLAPIVRIDPISPKIQGKEAHWKVRNPNGLHIRPAATLVEVLSTFQADYQLIKGNRRVNPLSLNQIGLIQIKQGDEITLIASGEQEDEAIAAFLKLAQNDFGEKQLTPIEKTVLKGVLVKASMIKADAFLWQESELLPEISTLQKPDINLEINLLRQAIIHTISDLTQYANKATHKVGEHIGAIFKGHIMMLEDDDLINAVISRIKTKRHNAQQSWFDELSERVAIYQRLNDPYLRARELDLRDLRNHVLSYLQGKETLCSAPSHPIILIAKEIFPSTLLKLNTDKVLGIALSEGNPRSHSAIIASEMKIPMLVELGESLFRINPTQKIILDPSEETLCLSF